MLTSRAVPPCLLLAAAVFAPTAAAPREADMKDWARGPVLYIIRKAEAQAFRALDNDDDRALFIERFWARRDPTPATLANEYRQLFWERVNHANSRFIDSSKPGWKTDRGKIHILYGAPREKQEDLGLAPDGPISRGRGVIRWLYDRPEGRLDLDATVVVPFVREQGQWRLSHDPKLAGVFWDPRSIRDAYQQPFNQYADGTLAGRSELSVMLDLGRLQDIPTQAQSLIERVETIESYRTEPVEAQVHRYVHPEHQRTLVVVTVDISHIPAPSLPAVIARFVAQAGDGEPRMLGEDSFRIEERDGRRMAQGRIVLEHGTYDLTLLVADPKSAGTGFFRSTFVSPEPTDQLRFSDVVLASELETLDYAALASYDEPFLLGPFRVLPRLKNHYRHGETVKLFLEVYGGSQPYRATYQVEGQETDGRWVALGRPVVNEQSPTAIPWTLPTSERWPAGAYRVRVEVVDAADRLIATHVPFRLEDRTP